MPIFYMMIGLPGSGKSYYAQALQYENQNAVIVSSDSIREEFFGSESCQDDPERVFKEMLNRTKYFLKLNHTVIYDATNISSKRRRALLRELAKIECKKIAVFMATPYEACLARNAMRERKVPEAAIKRMYINFNVPCKQEGFDYVDVVYPNGMDSFDFKHPADVVRSMVDLPHDNPHHSNTIGDHMYEAFMFLEENKFAGKLAEDWTDDDMTLGLATMLHDIGKPFTKTFVNSKGESSDIAHYYNHNNVGAYDLFFLIINEQLKIDIALLIQYHMNYYTSWNQSKKALEKDRIFLGERLFNMLEDLHACDIAAH